MGEKVHGRWRWPGSLTVGALAFAALAVGAMRWYAEQWGTDEAFVDAFRGWIAIAVLSLGVWIAVFVRGLAAVRDRWRRWPQERLWWAWHIVAYTFLVAAVVTLLLLNDASQTIVVPIDGFVWVTRALILLAGIAAGPWVLTVWLAHQRLRTLRAEVEQAAMDSPAIAVAVEHSLAVWAVIERAALSLALLVSTAVFLSGALRVALISSGALDEQTFPIAAVLGYGAFFAAVLAIAVVPLLLAWRSTTVRLVEVALGNPENGIPDQAWLDAQARLQTRLHLDATLLRHPISALSIASPLLTAFLATLVPTN